MSHQYKVTSLSVSLLSQPLFFSLLEWGSENPQPSFIGLPQSWTWPFLVKRPIRIQDFGVTASGVHPQPSSASAEMRGSSLPLNRPPKGKFTVLSLFSTWVATDWLASQPPHLAWKRIPWNTCLWPSFKSNRSPRYLDSDLSAKTLQYLYKKP